MRQEGTKSERRWVAAAATALVIATWGALALSRTPARTDADEVDHVAAGGSAPPSAISSSSNIPGFRSDAYFLPDDESLGFMEIGAGAFTMGSDPGLDTLAFDVEWWGEGRVQGTVEVPAFLMASYEVTGAQFAAFVLATGYRVADERALLAGPDHPVAFVAWTDALAYTRWLDAALREAASTPAEIARRLKEGWRVGLPSEAEWEKAARGTDARIYPWGNEPRRDRANYRSRATTPVGSFDCPECAYGLSDMSGNVWEWTRSPYQPYPYDESDDGDDLDREALYVMRGGSFGDPEQHIRAANRGGADPGARRPFIGFRLVISRF